MAVQGWYPDPGGAPGRYRYFDGSAWSSQTSTDPRQPPPAPAPDRPPARHPRSAALLPVLLLALVLVVGGIFVVRTVSGSSPSAGSDPVGSRSGGIDDSSPTPSSPSRTPSGSTTSRPPPDEGPLVDCPTGDPAQRLAHVEDGRVHGGNLSFRPVSAFGPAAVEYRLSFATDVLQQTQRVNADPAWIAQLAVGRLPGANGVPGDAKATVQRFADCTVNSSFYRPYGRLRPVLISSKAVTVSGHPSWQLVVDIRVEASGLPFAGDHAVFLVVPDESDWGLFFGAVPIGDRELTTTLDGVVRDLRAT